MNLELVNAEEVGTRRYGKRRYGKSRKKYTRKQLIEKIQLWTKNHEGISPKQEDFTNNPNYPNFSTYMREFGNWNNGLIFAGIKPNNHIARSRQAEIQTLSEFKIDGAIDLSGENRRNSCDGICPKGEMFDTKSALLTRKHGLWGWIFNVTINQLEDASYLFLRAYANEDFTKKPLHVWRIPIEFMNNRTNIFIYKDNHHGTYNVDNMRKYEI